MVIGAGIKDQLHIRKGVSVLGITDFFDARHERIDVGTMALIHLTAF